MFNHAYDISFEVFSSKEDHSDVTPKMLREAIRLKLLSLTNEELMKVCTCFDTIEAI